jgi:hypothetical protein
MFPIFRRMEIGERPPSGPAFHRIFPFDLNLVNWTIKRGWSLPPFFDEWIIFDLCCDAIATAPTHSHKPRMKWGTPVVLRSALVENVWATRPKTESTDAQGTAFLPVAALAEQFYVSRSVAAAHRQRDDVVKLQAVSTAAADTLTAIPSPHFMA